MNLLVHLFAALIYLLAYWFIIRAVPRIGIAKARYWSGGFIGAGILISLLVGYVTRDALSAKLWAVAIFFYLFLLWRAEKKALAVPE